MDLRYGPIHLLPINFEFKFLIVFNLIHYIGIFCFADGIVKHYNEAKKELGITQFIERSVLEDQKNGYVLNDTCIFGVEIFIIRPAKKLETLTILHNPPNNKLTWKILHFSNLSDPVLYWSDTFVIGQIYLIFVRKSE